MGLVGPAVFAEDMAVYPIHFFHQYGKSALFEYSANNILNRGGVAPFRDEQVADHKTVAAGLFGRKSRIGQFPFPKAAGDVGQDAASVSLAVDEAGSMLHFDQRVDGIQEVVAPGISVLFDDGDNPAAVVFLLQQVAKTAEVGEPFATSHCRDSPP